MTKAQQTPTRFAALAIVVALALGVAAAPAAQAATSATATGTSVILKTTNQYRANAGVSALTRSTAVDAVAQRYAGVLRDRHEREGDSFKLSHSTTYMVEMPQEGLRGWGENIAYACGYGGAENIAKTIMRGWWNSTGHRDNILRSQYTHIGIGFVYVSRTDCGYAVQNFGRYTQNPDGVPTQFSDVPRTHQFYNQIEWLANEGITTGYADGTFRPKDEVSREAFAAFLYRLAGRPNVSLPSRSPFKDVPTNAQFYREIVWLSQQNITTGWADGTFRPRDEIDRNAMAAFLYRFEGRPSYSPPNSSPFRDLSRSSKFYKEITWLRSAGITTGYADGTFRPYSSVTREATAAFLQRLAN